MSACCVKDPKLKLKKTPPVKFLPRQYGDLNIMYDVLNTYDNNYQAQVTIDNISPLGRLDNWNLTWEWMRGEFINSMRGADLPPEREKDEQVGNLPNCCKNGTLLPPIMNSSLSQSIFQLNVFKIPPDLNRTAIYPPQNWKISGVLNPHYTCGPPKRVSPTEFPDPSGLMSHSYAMASWQVSTYNCI